MNQTGHCMNDCANRHLNAPEVKVVPGVNQQYRFAHDDGVMPEMWKLSDHIPPLSDYYKEVPLAKKVVCWRERREIRQLYRVEEEEILGAGSFGKCVKGFCNTLGFYRAIKITPKAEPKVAEMARDEVRLLKTIDHENIISMVESFEDGTQLYLVMNLCEGGSLADHVQNGKHFSEHEALALLRPILEALKYLHELCICHRDLKHENFLLERRCPIVVSVLKMIDFGFACDIRPGEILRVQVGTPNFIAPEVLQEYYTEACDIWSCGVIFYVLLSGEYPFEAATVPGIYEKIKLGNFCMQTQVWDRVTNDAKQLVRALLKHKYRDRITARKALATEIVVTKTPMVEWV
jgi:calcium-dependent protein kinase